MLRTLQSADPDPPGDDPAVWTPPLCPHFSTPPAAQAAELASQVKKSEWLEGGREDGGDPCELASQVNEFRGLGVSRWPP